MHIFVGNMSHVMDFTILENIEANIDPTLSQVVFGRPFMEITKLILDREQGLITFTVILSEDDHKKGCEMASDLESGFYMDVDKLGPPYKEEIKRINLDASIKANGSRKDEGGVTNFSKKTNKNVFTESGDSVIFDEEKPESSLDFCVDDSWMTI
ncbi:hypothetical protein Tco_0718674 [Tanacetum coccineum]